MGSIEHARQFIAATSEENVKDHPLRTFVLDMGERERLLEALVAGENPEGVVFREYGGAGELLQGENLAAALDAHFSGGTGCGLPLAAVSGAVGLGVCLAGHEDLGRVI